MSKYKDSKNFENMLELAKFGADRHNERRQVLFRIYISYMTLLVVIAGLILKHWNDDVLENYVFTIGVSIFLFLIGLFYWQWLRIFYKAADYDVRRRDFYLSKAQVICYYMSECLSQYYSGCKQVDINLGGGRGYKISEKCLFKRRKPDIKSENYLDDPPDLDDPPTPTVWNNWHFWFHFFGPIGLTILIILALSIKFLNL